MCARGIFADFLQAFPFWLVDVAPMEGISFPILTPLFGFKSITAPEINVDIKEIKEGNYFFSRKVATGGSASNVILTRGTSFYDSDFWRWIRATLLGDTRVLGVSNPVPSSGALRAQIGGPTPRRVLLLIHYFSRNPFGTGAAGTAVGLAGTAALAGVVGAAVTGGSAASGAAAAVQAGAGAGIGAAGVGPFEFAARVPAKAWVLTNVLPVRYKAGSDFDASSTEVSIAELELAVEVIEEIALLA